MGRRNVDEEIVRMQFDNAHFQEGVQESLQSIDRLQKRLNFKTTGVDEIAKDVYSIQNSFSALETVAVTVLSRITNAAIDTGKKVINAFTFEPILSGFQEYETQINAVQTILANTSSKGTTLNQVNDALDELNRYADMTIYNFTEMTRNIGTFTAAGVDLDTSVQAIKGIANLAAVSGSTSQQASTAMYQLSQALAAGTVKLQDWNSVVNAGMGGQVFQDALKETARVHGVNIDAMINKEGSFRETLKDGWLTASVLTETLAKFTGDLNEEQLRSIGYTDEQISKILEMGKMANDAATKVKTFTQLMDTLKEAAQSGWTQTWEILIGDFEEAKELLTKISDVVGGFINEWSNARNEMLQNWKNFGGRTLLLEALENSLKGILSVLKPIGEAFREVFPRVTSAQLMRLTKSFWEFSRTIGLTEESATSLKNAFRGLFSILKQVAMVIVTVVKGAFKILYSVGDLFDELVYSIIGSLGQFIFECSSSVTAADLLASAFDFVNEKIKQLNQSIKTFTESERFKSFSKAITILFNGLADSVKNFLNNIKSMDSFSIGGIFDALRKFLRDVHSSFVSASEDTSWFATVLEAFGLVIANILNAVGISFDTTKNIIGDFVDGVVSKFENVSLGTVIAAFLGAGVVFAVFNFIKGLFKNTTSLYSSFAEIVGGLSDILSDVRGAISAFGKEKRSKAIINYAMAIAILAGSLALLASLDTTKVIVATGVILTLSAAMAAISVIVGKFGDGIEKMEALAKVGLGIALFSASVALLVKAFQDLEILDTKTTLLKVSVIVGIAAALSGMAILLSKYAPELSKGSVFLLAIGLSISTIVKSLNSVAGMDAASVLKSITILLSIMGGLSLLAISARKTALTMEEDGFSSKMKSGADVLGIFALVMMLKAVTGVIKELENIDASQLGKGLLLGLFMAELSASMLLISKAGEIDIENSLKAIGVLAVMGLVVGEIMAIAAVLSYLDLGSMIPEIASISIIFAELTGAMLVLSLIKDFNPAAVLKAVGVVSLILLAIGGLVGLIGYLNQDDALSNAINNGIPVLISVADAIGGFVGHLAGSLISSLANGVLEVFPIFGEKISRMITELKPGLDAIDSIPDGVPEKAKSLAIALLALSGADLILGLKNAIPFFGGTSNLESMGAGLEELGPHMAKFFESVKDVTPEQADAAVNMAIGLAKFAKEVPNTGGLIAKVFGDNNDLSAWGEQLSSLGESLAKFAASTENINTEQVESVANAATLLAKFNDAIPESGGKLQEFFGDKGIAKFSEDLIPLGENLAKFAASTEDIDSNKVEGVANAAILLAKFNSKIPASGGKIQEFFGSHDIKKFGSDLAVFGFHLRLFANSVKDVKEEELSGAINAGTALAELNKLIPESGGFLSGLFGDKNLETFGTHLGKFGESMAEFFNAIKEIGSSTIYSSISAIRSVIDLLTSIEAVKKRDLSNFGAALKKIGTDSIKDFVESVNGESSLKKIKDAGVHVIEGFVIGIRSKIKEVTAVAEEMAGAVESGTRKRLEIKSPSRILKLLGGFAASGLIVGMLKKLPEIGSAASEMGEGVLNAIESALGVSSDGLSGEIFDIGVGSMDSLAKGISSNSAPVQAAKDKATEIAEAFQEIFDQIDLTSNRTSLEQQLYEAMYQDVEGMDIEKLASEITSKSKLLDLQNERLMVSSLKYQTMLNEFGEGSTEAQTAYNDYLQAAIDVANATSELKQKQNELAEAQMINGATEEAQLELYQQYLQENMRDLSQFGFTYEQLEADARKRAGLPVKAAKSKTQEINDIVREGATAIFDETGKVIDVIYDDVKPRAEKGGAEVAEAYAEGMEERSDVVTKSGSETAEQGVVGIESEKPGYAQAGVNATDAYVDGMQSNIEKVAENAAIIAQAGYESAMSAIQNMQNATVNDALKQLASVAEGTGDFEVGGLTKVDDIERLIAKNKEFQRNVDIAAGMSNDEVKAIVRQYEKESGSKLSQDIKESDRSIVVGSIIQNNFSSRQLDRDGVYRDTKSLFNNIGGTVNSAAKAKASSATKDSSK